MSQKSLWTDLLGIQGWNIADVMEEEVCVVARLARRPGTGYRCSRCGEGCLFAYDSRLSRRIRDFPIWGRRFYLEVELMRVNCPNCGVVIEGLDWLEPSARQTLRYEKYVAGLCDLLPALDVADWEGLDKGTVYRIDKKWLQRREAQREEHMIRFLGIDEIALRKGHRYATVFYDLERKEVVGLVKRRRERAVGGFFRRLGTRRCRKIEAVCMDLWQPFLNSVRRHCKNAAIVFDKFHVYKYLSDAIEEVRRHQQGVCSDEQGKLIKGTRWLWLKSRGNLRRKDKQTLDEIMAINQYLQKAYLLKEDFTDFYACLDRDDANKFLKGWLRRCQQSGLQPFIKLAKRIKRWAFGILAFFEYHITNGVSEGINNKIKVLKRRSYGFHDDQYFFLKILNATGALPTLQSLTHPHF